MKKITLSAVFLATMTVAFFAMPSYAQTAQQKASEINTAGKSAEQSQSSTESRDINNAAWDGAKGNVSSALTGNNVAMLGGTGNNEQPQEKSSFENTKVENITPWKDYQNAIIYATTAALVMLLLAHMLMVDGFCDITVQNTVKHKIGIALAWAAAAAFATALGFSIAIMTKYQQYALGGVYATFCTIGIAACIMSALGGADGLKPYAARGILTELATIGAFTGVIMSICVLGTRVGGYLHDNETIKNYCEKNPNHKQCDKKPGFTDFMENLMPD